MNLVPGQPQVCAVSELKASETVSFLLCSSPFTLYPPVRSAPPSPDPDHHATPPSRLRPAPHENRLSPRRGSEANARRVLRRACWQKHHIPGALCCAVRAAQSVGHACSRGRASTRPSHAQTQVGWRAEPVRVCHARDELLPAGPAGRLAMGLGRLVACVALVRLLHVLPRPALWADRLGHPAERWSASESEFSQETFTAGPEPKTWCTQLECRLCGDSETLARRHTGVQCPVHCTVLNLNHPPAPGSRPGPGRPAAA
jgi:hypothetical protein